MGNLESDTRLEGENGTYGLTISDAWDFWQPNGGYLSAIALRAAGAETDLPRPAAYYCQYLNPAASNVEATLRVTTLRRSRRTHAIRVQMMQQEQPILEALVWTVAGIGGLDYSRAQMPEVAPPDELRNAEEIHAPDEAPFRFWHNLETRPVTWQGRWDERPLMHPLWRVWTRFRPVAAFDDPYVDAGRSVILIDTMLYPAAAAAHEGTFPFVAPSVDLAVRWHAGASDSDWILSSTEAPIAVDGLIGGYAATWSLDGRLMATGGGQMIQRPIPS